MRQYNIKISLIFLVFFIYMLSLITYTIGSVKLSIYLTGLLFGVATCVYKSITLDIDDDELTYKQIFDLLIKER